MLHGDTTDGDEIFVVNHLGGSAGNLVEWFDWDVYAAFTIYFASSFFPTGDRTAELLRAAAVFAVAPTFYGGSIKSQVPGIVLVRGLNQKGLFVVRYKAKPSVEVVSGRFKILSVIARGVPSGLSGAYARRPDRRDG